MYVQNYILPKKHLTTLQIGENIKTAVDKIEKGGFLSLPVLDGDSFVGILKKESIFRKYFEEDYEDKELYLTETKVNEVMSKEFKSTKENEFIENATYLLGEAKTPFLAVFNEYDRFTGILTHNSIFNGYSEIFGAKNGTRITIFMHNIPGRLAHLTNTISKTGANINNLAVKDAKIMNIYKVIVRVSDCDIQKLKTKILDAGFRIEAIDIGSAF